MQVEIKNKEPINLPLLGHIIFGTDEDCDVILESDFEEKQKICSVVHDQTACMLEIFNDNTVSINNYPVKEMAILHPGDEFTIGKEVFKIIDENKLPKICKNSFKINRTLDSSENLITSVSGLRSFNDDNNGELFIIGSENSFTYKPNNEQDIPFSVSYVNDQLTVLCQKDKNIKINGNNANYALLENGDYITTDYAKFCVESPGSSSFSKYSPSHPRNIQLSEEYYSDEPTDKQGNNFLKKNLWWLSLIFGLVVIAAVLYFIKNH